MSAIRSIAIPPTALLQAYGSGEGYADCYCTEVASETSLESFVGAFYTTPLFKVEQTILRWFASKPSSDADAFALAKGTTDKFAAWEVEGRTFNQLLLTDFTGRTRSWLMTESLAAEGGRQGTRLYFGSAVVPLKDRDTGEESMGFGFRALLGFHKAYSRLLLQSALSKLKAEP